MIRTGLTILILIASLTVGTPAEPAGARPLTVEAIYRDLVVFEILAGDDGDLILVRLRESAAPRPRHQEQHA